MNAIGNLSRSRARERLIAGLLRLACRICRAKPAQGCDPEHPDGEMIRLNREPDLLMIHADRAADAVTAGLISRDTLLAQFHDGTAPAVLAGTRRGRRTR